jgi:hypothetical protein
VKTAQTEALWHAYRSAHPEVEDRYDVVAFGDSAQMADELCALTRTTPTARPGLTPI